MQTACMSMFALRNIPVSMSLAYVETVSACRMVRFGIVPDPDSLRLRVKGQSFCQIVCLLDSPARIVVQIVCRHIGPPPSCQQRAQYFMVLTSGSLWPWCESCQDDDLSYKVFG